MQGRTREGAEYSAWHSDRFAIGDRYVSIRLFPVSRVDANFLADWLDLERRSEEGNMFLSPLFVLPAVAHLTRERVLLLAISRQENHGEGLIGLGAFVARPPSTSFPLPHLESFQSQYTFMTGMLLDRQHQELALEGLKIYLSSKNNQWCGIKFKNRLAGASLDRICGREAKSTLHWEEASSVRRAILNLDAAEDQLNSVLAGGGLGKDLRRKLRRLHALGPVSSRVHVGVDVTSAVVERFLELEDLGWKGVEKSSLLSQKSHALFFRQMTKNFAADGRAVFCELLLGDQVISSTSNFMSGRVGYAFKIGWDPEFAKVGPGLINELELMRWVGSKAVDLDYFDSGAQEGSYINKLWQERVRLTSGVLVGGKIGLGVLPAMRLFRNLKRAVLN